MTRQALSVLVDAVSWTVPPVCQGQTVEVSYGWHEGTLLRMTRDRSEPSDTPPVVEECDSDASDELDETWHPVNGEPDVSVDAWTELDVSVEARS